VIPRAFRHCRLPGSTSLREHLCEERTNVEAIEAIDLQMALPAARDDESEEAIQSSRWLFPISNGMAGRRPPRSSGS